MRNKRKLTVAGTFMVFLGVIGCATTVKMVETKQQGLSQVYHVSTSQAWKIATTVLEWENIDVVEENRSKGYLVAQSGKEWAPWSTMTVVWVDRVDRKHTKVTVFTKRRMGVKDRTSETTFQEHFAQAVQIVRAGKFLPPVPPI